MIIRTFLITDKEQSHSSGFQEYFFHPQPFSQSAQRYDTQKFQPFGRNLSETVLQPCLESEQVLIQFQSVQFTIKQHTFAAAGDILIREKQFQITFHLTFIHKVLATDFLFSRCLQLLCVKIGKLILFQFLHRFSQYLLISFIAQIGNETTLLRPQHISCSTDIQILHGYMDTAAQITEILNGLKTALCLGSQ